MKWRKGKREYRPEPAWGMFLNEAGAARIPAPTSSTPPPPPPPASGARVRKP